MNNEIIISNVAPQDIVIGEGGATGITAVYVNGVDVTVGSIAYVIVPTKTSELINDSGFITSEQDPTVPFHVKQITTSDITRWNNKQDELVSGQNIKTINNQSILGNGNLDVETVYTAGTGINITDEKVISNTITSYNDLTDLPTIPTSTSQLTNDSDFVSSSALSSVAFTGDYDDLLNKPDLSEYITKYVSDLVNYYNKDFFFNILPKVSDSGTVVSLDDTIKGSQMYLTLGATELSQDGTPTPDSPQTIHTISGSNTLKVEGKNLLDTSYLVEANANKTYQGYGFWAFKLTDELGTYTLSRANNTMYADGKYLVIGQGSDLATAYNNKEWLMHPSLSNLNNKSRTITNTDELWLFTGNSQANIEAMLNYAGYLQLEKGSTATTYTPYTLETADVDLGDIEYCKIGTYEDVFFKNVESSPYYDENLDDGIWYLKQVIGKVVLDGSESGWNALKDNSNTWNYYKNYNDINKNLANLYCLSNYFTYNNVDYLDNTIGKFKVGGTSPNKNGNIVFNPFDDTTNELATFKTWLSTHNTIVYYPLETPTFTPITGTLAEQLELIYSSLTSEQDQTNISQVNADLPFTISATTLKDLSSL